MFPKLTPAVRLILFANIAVFILSVFAQDTSAGTQLVMKYLVLYKSNLLGFRSLDFPYDGYFQPIQIFTYFFNHGGFAHILFNMMALASLGPYVEDVIGTPRFFKFYMFSGIFAGILLAFLDPTDGPVVGASGAISGVLVLFAIFFPNAKLGLFFLPIYFEAKNVAVGIALISTIFILTSDNAGGISHFGHLAGMASALLLYEAENVVHRLGK
jgi:membrane associated rhomboid family serine protease